MSEGNGILKEPCVFSGDKLIMFSNMASTIDSSHLLISSISESQKSMASSAKSMALTNATADVRYAKLQDMLQEVNDRAAGKNQIPITSHLLILATTVLITLLMVTYVTKQTVEGTLSSLKVDQGK